MREFASSLGSSFFTAPHFSAVVVVGVVVVVANWSAGLIGTPATVAGVQKWGQVSYTLKIMLSKHR